MKQAYCNMMMSSIPVRLYCSEQWRSLSNYGLLLLVSGNFLTSIQLCLFLCTILIPVFNRLISPSSLFQLLKIQSESFLFFPFFSVFSHLRSFLVDPLFIFLISILKLSSKNQPVHLMVELNSTIFSSL